MTKPEAAESPRATTADVSSLGKWLKGGMSGLGAIVVGAAAWAASLSSDVATTQAEIGSVREQQLRADGRLEALLTTQRGLTERIVRAEADARAWEERARALDARLSRMEDKLDRLLERERRVTTGGPR